LVLDLVLVPEPDPKSDPVLAGGSNQPNRVTAQQWFVHGYLNVILLLSISVVPFQLAIIKEVLQSGNW
jgi:hypothetical protein